MESNDTNTPKNHHFIAKMHVERFTDDKGRLWAFNKKSGKIFPASPKSIFAESHLYTIEDADGAKDTSLETDFSALEGAANLIIKKLVAAARSGQTCQLTPEERGTWDQYFYLQWKRVPDVHAKVASLTEAESFLDNRFAEMRARDPDAASEVDKLDTPEERARLLQGGKVHAIRKDPGEFRAVLASRGLALLHINPPDEAFAIGSLPIVRKSGDLRAQDSEAWLPISSDLAVGPADTPGTITVIQLNDPKEIWRMNRVTAGQSSIFAAASKCLIEKLVADLPTTSRT